VHTRLAIALAASVLAAPQTAAAVTLGPDVSGPPTTGLIGYSAQFTPPGGTHAIGELANVQAGTQLSYGVASPFDGRITRWRFRALYGAAAGAEDAAMQLIVLDATDTIKRTGPVVLIDAGTDQSTLFDASTEVPILAGEHPGVRLTSPAGQSLSIAVYSDTGATIWQSALNPNRTTSLDSSLAIEVEVEEGAAPPPSDSSSGPGPPPPPALLVACGEKASCPVLEDGPLRTTPNGRKALVQLICPPEAGAICIGVVRLYSFVQGRNSAKPKLIGDADYSINPGVAGKAKVKLTKVGRKLISERRKVKVRIEVEPQNSPVQSETTKLLAPKAG
jgi:hypothetical protein